MSSKSSEIEEIKTYHNNGELWVHYYRKNDKLHGEYKSFYDNANPCEHYFYKDGGYHGEYIWYHYSGELWEHCFYNNGTEEALSEYAEDIENPTDDEFMNLSMVFGDNFFASNTFTGVVS